MSQETGSHSCYCHYIFLWLLTLLSLFPFPLQQGNFFISNESVLLNRHGGGQRVLVVRLWMWEPKEFFVLKLSTSEENKNGSNWKQSSLPKVTVKSDFLTSYSVTKIFFFFLEPVHFQQHSNNISNSAGKYLGKILQDLCRRQRLPELFLILIPSIALPRYLESFFMFSVTPCLYLPISTSFSLVCRELSWG